MQSKKWVVILLLLSLILLPRLIENDDLRGYEIVFKEAVTIKEEIFENNHQDRVHKFGLLSPSFFVEIEGKSLNVAAARGDLTPWYKSKTGNVNRHFDQFNQLVLSEKASQSVFFTANGLNNQVDYENKVFAISDIANLDTLKLQGSTLDGLISYPKQTQKVERIYVHKYDNNGKVLSNSDIDQWLSKYGISGGVRTDYIALNAMRDSLQVTAETIVLVILLIVVAKKLLKARLASWKSPSNYPFLLLFLGLAFLFRSIPFHQLPLEWVDEKIVSLTFYVDVVIKAKASLYGWFNEIMSLQGFSLKIDVVLLIMWYLILGVGITKALRIKEKH